MKKNILIVILLLVSIISVLNGFVQASEAEKQAAIAVEQAELAKAETKRANVLANHAITKAAEVENAQAALRECENKNP
ncbi:MAG: hypothetical protein ABJP45_11545 [Cyclobacteriaceae bacterium]